MLRAISLWQPWASLWITHNAKIHETRSWPTRHRGPLAVHASKKVLHPTDFNAEHFALVVDRLGLIDRSKPANPEEVVRRYYALPRGGIVGVVDIIDCVPTERGTHSVIDLQFGNWTAGRYAWRRSGEIRALTEPVYCRGFQGIWTLDSSLLAAIERRAGADPRTTEASTA